MQRIGGDEAVLAGEKVIITWFDNVNEMKLSAVKGSNDLNSETHL